MSRQLRPRRNRPKYTLADLGTDNENQSQDNDKPSPIDDMGGNESDFTPNKKKRKAREDNDSDSDGDMSDDISEVDRINETRQPMKSSLSKKKEHRRSKSTVKGPSPKKRTSHSLPAPLVHHRHRAVSLFSRSGRVE